VATVERATNLHRAELLTTLRAALPGLWVAVAAFVLALATIVVSLFRQPLDLVISLAGLVAATCLAIAAILAVGPIRTIAVIAAFASAAVTPSLLLLTGEPASAVVVVLLLTVAAEGARRAVRAAIHRPPATRIPGTRVGPSSHPVLLANPRSGGGTAEKVALAHDLAFVYVPVGTRNHFAKDLGLDPGDPVAALDAFGDAEETRIDLGLVADRVFVNNVSFGVYAMIVGTAGYRENKPVTAWQALPSVLGPDAGPVDLRFTGRMAGSAPASSSSWSRTTRIASPLIAGSGRGKGWISASWGSSRPGRAKETTSLPSRQRGGRDSEIHRGRGCSGRPPSSRSGQLARSRLGWTARRWCSIRHFGSGACPAPFASVCPPPQGPWAAPRAQSDVPRSFTGDEMATGRRSDCHRTLQPAAATAGPGCTGW
jgi:hypothetical protein